MSDRSTWGELREELGVDRAAALQMRLSIALTPA